MMFPIRVYAVYVFLLRSYCWWRLWWRLRQGSIAEQSSMVVVHARQNPLRMRHEHTTVFTINLICDKKHVLRPIVFARLKGSTRGQLFAGNAAQLSNHVGHEQSPTFEQGDLTQWSFHCLYNFIAYKSLDSVFFYSLGTGFSLQISNAAAHLSLGILPDHLFNRNLPIHANPHSFMKTTSS